MSYGRAAATAGPGSTVLAAFGLDAQPEPLGGGPGRSWRADLAVLERSDVPLSAVQWQAQLLGRLAGRAPPPS